MQNLLGYAGLVGNNPYSPFQNAIPFSGGAGPGVGYIAGMPTQAWSGQPIGAPPQPTYNPLSGGSANTGQAAQPPGMTINSNQIQQPAQGSLLATPAMQQLSANYQAAQAAKSPQQLAIDAQNDAMRQQMLQQQATMSQVQAGNGGFGNMPGGAFNPGSYMPMQPPTGPRRPQQQGAAQPSGSAANGAMLSRQDYLSRLANPGPLPTYGAQPPQAGQTATGTPPPNVLAAFLSANKGNTPFSSTLRALQPTGSA